MNPRTPFSVLDVGTGAGDIPRAIAKWAEANGRTARIWAVDLRPDILRFATETGPRPITLGFARADVPRAARPPRRGGLRPGFSGSSPLRPGRGGEAAAGIPPLRASGRDHQRPPPWAGPLRGRLPPHTPDNPEPDDKIRRPAFGPTDLCLERAGRDGPGGGFRGLAPEPVVPLPAESRRETGGRNSREQIARGRGSVDPWPPPNREIGERTHRRGLKLRVCDPPRATL